MLKRMIRKVFFKRKRYARNYKTNYVTWNAHNREMNALQRKIDNLISHLGLSDVGGTGLIGDKKDAKKFSNQWGR